MRSIANIIAELMYAGKSVLFVSEKAAALDVVHNRLCEASLDDFILPLHSHKATRKEVAVALGQALETRPKATPSFSDADRSRLVRLRQELSEYAQAMNERRSPLGRSLHDGLGRVVQLQRLLHAPAASVITSDLSATDLAQLLAAARQLSRAWGPVSRGEQFLWRSLRDASISAARQQQIEQSIGDAISAVDELEGHLEDVRGTLGIDVAGSICAMSSP